MNNTSPDHLPVVLSDANVLYSRVLRDYLLYAAEYRLITITWSQAILDEMLTHMVAKLPNFTEESARRLRAAMTKTFPYTERNPEPEDYRSLIQFKLPDEGDRHVLAAALAADASVICTSNIRDFPADIVQHFSFTVMTPDELFEKLITLNPDAMRLVHTTSVANLPGATDTSTITALQRAGAHKTAAIMIKFIELNHGNH